VTIYRQVSKYRRCRGEKITISTSECEEVEGFIVSRAALTEDVLMIHFGGRFRVVVLGPCFLFHNPFIS